MLVFSKDKPHRICLSALGYQHIHTLGHEMNFPTAASLISPGVTCSFVRREGVSVWSEFCAVLRCAEVSQIDPWLQSRQLPGAADIELFGSTPPGLDARTNSTTGAILEQQLQAETLFSGSKILNNCCQADAGIVCKG